MARSGGQRDRRTRRCRRARRRPQTARRTGRATDTHAPSLYRLLRAGADIGLFTEHDGQVFELTALGDVLRADSPVSLRNFAIWTGLPAERHAWAGLADAVRTGHTAFPEALGKPVWDYLHDQPDVLGVFDRAMTEASRQIIAPVVAAYDFSGGSRRSSTRAAGGARCWPPSSPPRPGCAGFCTTGPRSSLRPASHCGTPGWPTARSWSPGTSSSPCRAAVTP
ncbi:hypothetical protein STENM327S_07256 [Streptomyces tendae]